MTEGYDPARVAADQARLATHPLQLEEGLGLQWNGASLVADGELPAPSDWWKVGRYHEWLCDRMLSLAYGREAVRSGIQLRHQGQTLGELDHLIATPEHGWVHLEVAYKFYLHLPETGAWLGPNPVDRFDLKLSQMRNQQAPLLRAPDAKEALQSLEGIPLDADVGESTVLRLECFRHLGTRQEGSAFASSPSVGTWCTRSEAIKLFANGEPTGVEEHRPYWLSPSPREHARLTPSILALGESESVDARAHFRTRLFSLTGGRAADGEFGARLMVVDDTWPEDARRRLKARPLEECADEIEALLKG